MRIALCFAGQPRNVQECYGSILNNIIVPNGIEDVFFHTWWQPRFETTGYNVGDGTIVGKLQKDSLNLIESLYTPKKSVVEDDTLKKFHDEGDIKSQGIPMVLTKTLFPIFYSRQASNLLKKQYAVENGIEYDAIIITRTDLFVRNKIKVDEMDLDFMNMTQYKDTPFDPDRLGDTVVIGTEGNMNTYANIYDNLPLISTKMDEFDIHNIIGKWLIMNGISVVNTIHYPKDVAIYRVRWQYTK